MTKEECLDRAAEEFGYPYFYRAVTEQAHSLEDIVYKAMEYYTIACLERAAENANIKRLEKPSYEQWQQPVIFPAVVDKDSITHKSNLI